MDNFKFKLEKVLDMKIRKEEESKKEHAKALKEKIDIENELKDLNDKYIKYSNMNNVNDIVKRKVISSYLSSLCLRIDEKHLELEEKQLTLKEKQKDLIEKQVERKSLEKIKEKKYKEFKKEQDLKEQIKNDEYALQSYMRNKESDKEVY